MVLAESSFAREIEMVRIDADPRVFDVFFSAHGVRLTIVYQTLKFDATRLCVGGAGGSGGEE